VIAVHHPPAEELATFEIVDLGSSRSDLANRRELKFTLDGADVAKLRRLLEGNGRRQVHNHKISTVSSVYFDDARLSACHANLSGLGRRNKLRVRWYDSPLPGHDFCFEIKWRDNRITGKHRLVLRSDQALGGLSYEAIRAGLSAVLPQEYHPLLHKYSEPTLLVRYQREHFTLPGTPLRATLDYGIVFFDQTSKRSISTSFGHARDGFVVLEVKVPVGRERDVRSILSPLAARVGRCSKYVTGCQAFGMVHS
jgi:hypothetical protein